MVGRGVLSNARVGELEKRRYRAMLEADVETLEHMLDEGLTYTHSNGVVDTKATYLAGVRDKLWEYRNITCENERIVIRGGCGLVFCRLRLDVLVRGAPRNVDSNALTVWVQDAEHCRVVAVHSASVPV